MGITSRLLHFPETFMSRRSQAEDSMPAGLLDAWGWESGFVLVPGQFVKV